MSSSAFHPSALAAVWRRQLGSLLGNPLGYLFILLFVVAGAVAMYGFDPYFQRNISDLGPLWTWMPVFLAVLLPVLAMGAWSAEREIGTEELLLTLPLSVADAVVGKYLAILAYFTLALLCSASNVIMLAWLGHPDLGAVVANYVGWWVGGAALAAGALFASVLVALPAIALVIGLLIAGILLVLADATQFFDPFNRGLVPTGNLIIAAGVVIAFLSAAMLWLSARRWRPATRGQVVAQIASLVLGLALTLNVSRIANRYAVDVDTSSEGLASLSAGSRTILSEVKAAVTINAFISRELPQDLLVKAKEVEDKLKAVERLSGGRVTLTVHRPKDSVEGARMSGVYGIKPRKMVVDTVAGREMDDVFLGAVVTGGAREPITIEHFDAGLSVEYELLRAVRAVGGDGSRKVLGIAETDLKINGDFDMQTYTPIPGWSIVDEWKKQYDVRPVNLDTDVADDVAMLVVPQPSTLTQPQIERLHDYIWKGRPTLILEDAMPVFSMQGGRQDLIPRNPKRGNQQSQFQQQAPEEGPQKGEIKPLFRALGLAYEPDALVWSDYNPSHEFRNLIDIPLIWTSADQASYSNDDLLTGIKAALFPVPAHFTVDAGKPPGLSVVPLIKVPRGGAWGTADYDQMVMTSPFNGQVQIRRPNFATSGDPANPPILAARITGTMASAYAKAPAEPAGDGSATAAGAVAVGTASPQPINVVVIGDTDFASNQLFEIYRNEGNRIDRNKMRFLTDLRNIQLVGNAVDALMGDGALMALRTRQPEPRPLRRHEDVYIATQKQVREVVQQAESTQRSAVDAANKSLTDKVADIDKDESLDEVAKAHKKEEVRSREQRIVDARVEQENLAAEVKINQAKATQRDVITADRWKVRIASAAIPAALLLVVALFVLASRLAGERSHIPMSRKRN
jgi:ABC-2 type transport system permease protein